MHKKKKSNACLEAKDVKKIIDKHVDLEEELKRSEGRFRTLAAVSPDCIKMFSPGGELVYINPGGVKEHGFKKIGDAIGWNCRDTIAMEHRAKFDRALNGAKKGKTTTLEIRHTSKGSNREWCMVTFAPIKDEEGYLIGIFSVSRDITRIKKEENIIRVAHNRLQVISQKLMFANEKLKKEIALRKKAEKDLKSHMAKGK